MEFKNGEIYEATLKRLLDGTMIVQIIDEKVESEGSLIVISKVQVLYSDNICQTCGWKVSEESSLVLSAWDLKKIAW